MAGQDIRIRSREGGEFDCYLSLPAGGGKAPAVVLACAVHGVNADLRALADEFAGHGCIAAAPDLFWRTIPGPLGFDDERLRVRSQPRLEKIRDGEADMADTLAAVKQLPRHNGRAAAIGFCYGGPFAILGPKRLGYDAGLSCHGSQFADYLGELEGVTQPVCLIWGDQDHQAPAAVLDACRQASARMKNVQLHVIPGALHGFMFPGVVKAYSPDARAFSLKHALAMLDALR